jgi:hypothetical protein
MPVRAETPWRWIGRVFLWLVPAFAAWHFGAGLLAAAQAALATAGVNVWFPGLVEGWTRADAALDFVTRIQARAGGRLADLVFPVNARVYSYGIALFVALCLATDPRRWIGLLVGSGVLVGLAGWGVGFDLLVQVFISQGGLAARDYLPTGLERNLIGLGYQVGSILLPTVAPVVAWGCVHRAFLARWAGI